MLNPRLNLVVLRSANIDRAIQFYQMLGLTFTKHRHGKGPEHYSADTGGCIFEIYPLGPQQTETTLIRIGFEVQALETLLPKLESIGGRLIQQPQNSPWGRRAVIQDADHHTVELTEKPENSATSASKFP